MGVGAVAAREQAGVPFCASLGGMVVLGSLVFGLRTVERRLGSFTGPRRGSVVGSRRLHHGSSSPLWLVSYSR